MVALVQVGNAAGASATLSAPMFRNKLVSILPHSNFFFTAAERAAAYEELAGHAASGALRLAIERVPLADIPAAGRRLKTGAAPRKLIVVP